MSLRQFKMASLLDKHETQEQIQPKEVKIKKVGKVITNKKKK